MRHVLTGLAMIAVLLNACMPSPPPQPADTVFAPAPPAGTPRLYAAGQSVILQVRPGDCAETACLAFSGNKWRPMARTVDRNLPLLTLSEATGSAYGDDLWRTVSTNSAVLINTAASRQTIAAGYMDGPRIGLKANGRTTYVTAYAIETGDVLRAGGICLDGKDQPKASCARPLGDGRYYYPANTDLVVHDGKAWLLHHRPDRSANLVDLFALLAAPGTVHCRQGLVLDTGGQWAGPVEKALSPNLFISRAIDTSTDAARRRAIAAACPAEEPKADYKDRLKFG